MGNIERILIVDDNDANVLYFQSLLAQMDGSLKVFTASTGAQGEVMVQAERINFIICAWEMNPMPGTVFVQRVHRERLNRYLPFLIFSKRMDDTDIKLTQELGLNNVVKMPFDREKITALIQEIIAREDNISALEKKLRKVEYYISEHHYNEGLQLMTPDMLTKSTDGRAYCDMGEIWLGIRNLEKAEDNLKKCLNMNPENVNALRLLARVYSLSKRHGEAISMLEQMVAKSPKNLTSLLSLGSAYVSADQHDKARDVFSRAEALDAESRELKDQQGALAFKEGNIPLAAQLLAETTSGDDLARSFNDMGIAQIAGQNYEKGIQMYLNAIQLLTEKARLFQLKYNLGLAYYKKGGLKESFQYFCESYISDPSFEKAYSMLAKVSKEMKAQNLPLDNSLVEKVKEARKIFKEKNPNSTPAPSDGSEAA